MNQPYLLRVVNQTPTEFWVNNPTRQQADLAVAHGASGCTNNPAGVCTSKHQFDAD
jgi:hypothetical protein